MRQLEILTLFGDIKKNIGNFSVHVIYLKLLSFILKLLNPYLLELETRIFMDELLGCPGSALK